MPFHKRHIRQSPVLGALTNSNMGWAARLRNPQQRIADRVLRNRRMPLNARLISCGSGPELLYDLAQPDPDQDAKQIP